MAVEFSAPEYLADGAFQSANFRFSGDAEAGWLIERNGQRHLELGSGYRLLRVESCGVCSTDLARHFLPFPLPQITGHEVLAADESGGRFVVEINASHLARGVRSECPFCAAGLHTHCPERIVLGIHDLPGGFGPYVLAPVNAVIPLPDEIPSSAGVLVEPLAAALNAVDMVQPVEGETLAVLGPRRLGMLVVAALSAWRNTNNVEFEILALARHQPLLDLSRQFGATATRLVEGNGEAIPENIADVVIDTTGNPDALALASRLARREVHLKSTHGRPSMGLNHLTELVVDELRLGSYSRFESPEDEDPDTAWLADPDVHQHSGEYVLSGIEEGTQPGELPRADLAVVRSAEMADLAIRPSADHQRSVVKPRGDILFTEEARDSTDSPLIHKIIDDGLRLTSSRCGDFQRAIQLLLDDPELRQVGEKLVTHTFDNSDMNATFAKARSPECIKAVVRLT